MKTPTAETVIHQIIPNVRVQSTPLAYLGGGGGYRYQDRTIYLVNKDATDGTTLGVAVHEAFHALRHATGQSTENPSKYTVQERFAEEKVANDLAEPWIKAHLPPSSQKDAIGMIGYSRFIYTPTGQWYATGKLMLQCLPVWLLLYVIAFRGTRRLLAWKIRRDIKRDRAVAALAVAALDARK